ncbi:MAG: hypothetical protein ACI9Y1_002083 [Lentisphaeria bacterium]|jgi:hypothetical protein
MTKLKLCSTAISYVLIFMLIQSCAQKQNDGASYQVGGAYLHFPNKLTPLAPHDVDIALKTTLNREKKFDQVQRLFEVLSWQNFVALNWPTDEAGKPKNKIDEFGDAVWNGWKESYEVYQSNGAKPLPWGEHSLPSNFNVAEYNSTGVDKILFRVNGAGIHSKANVDDEIDQAFTGPIWDQNGNILRYEVLMNESEFDYLVSNTLYNIDGQIAFSKSDKKLVFPSANREEVGAIELKLAWKIIDEKHDIPSRFYLQNAWVYNEDGTYSKALVGMVGMHISLKTQSSPQWIWATFEHVDNLEANPLLSVDGKALKPLFYDPNCQICPVNVYPDLKGDYTQDSQNEKRNQIQRVLPLTKSTQDLNASVQEILKRNNSVLQYYQLIGTQWPTDPTSTPYPVSGHTDKNPPKLPEAVTNKSGGNPTPVYLTNMVMETYFQGATTTGKGNEFFNTKLGNIEAWHQIQGFKENGTNTQRIFGTEGCMGCHYSAAIATGVDKDGAAIYGAANTADFSWLLQLKAKFVSDK